MGLIFSAKVIMSRDINNGVLVLRIGRIVVSPQISTFVMKDLFKCCRICVGVMLEGKLLTPLI
jgi:hypothetical protein